MAVLDVLARVGADDLLGEADQAVLGRWSGWGSLPEVFDPSSDRWAEARECLRELLSEEEWRDASRSILNSLYTSLEVASAIWGVVAGLEFEGGRVLEPGCGAGTLLSTVRDGLEVALTGGNVGRVGSRGRDIVRDS